MAMASEVAIFERPELQDDIRPLYAETLSGRKAASSPFGCH